MKQIGTFNPAFGIEKFGFKNLGTVSYNLEAPMLYEESIRRNEAVIVPGGAINAETGIHTGRSPKDKHTVRDANTENVIWWENNNSITTEQFDNLLADFIKHAEGKDLFVQDLFGGADPAFRCKPRVICEFAWHSLFIRNLLIRPTREEVLNYTSDLTIIDLPTFKNDPKRHGGKSETMVAIDFTRKIMLIGGTSYAGEMKKSVFTYLNFILPKQNVMPMHCSANVGPQGDSAVFFGLSGTGKTTLLRIVAGLEQHTSGTLEIAKPSDNRPGNSMVFQGDSLFPWMTVIDNATYGPVRQKVMDRTQARERAMDMLGKHPHAQGDDFPQ